MMRARRKWGRLPRRSKGEVRSLPPSPVTKGISSEEFWDFFDWLPKVERDRLNFALHGPEWILVYAMICDKYWLKFRREKEDADRRRSEGA